MEYWITAIVILAALAGVLLWRFGQAKEDYGEEKAKNRTLEENTEAAKKARDIENKNAGLSDSAIHSKLSKWVRPKDR